MAKHKARKRRPARRRHHILPYLAPFSALTILSAALLFLPGSLGNPPGQPVELIHAESDSPDAPVKITRIDKGRYRVMEPSGKATRLTLDFRSEMSPDRDFHLAIRNKSGREIVVVLAVGPSGDGLRERARFKLPFLGGAIPPISWVAFRPESAGQHMRLNLQSVDSGDGIPAGQSMAFDEISWFDKPALDCLTEESWRTSVARDWTGYIPLFLLAGLGIIGFHFHPGRRPAVYLALFAFALALACSGAGLRRKYSPHSSADYRLAAAIDYVHSSNLNNGLIMGSNILQGRGPTMQGGWINIQRMPGYAFVVAASNLFNQEKNDLISVACHTVYGQLLLQALALGCFAFAAAGVFHPSLVAVLSAIVAVRPSQIDFTQADSVMLSWGLLILAAACLILAARKSAGSLSWKHYLVFHASMALFFSMRTDVLPGWIALSLYLHWRNWRYLAMPAVLFLAIGVPWGLYKTARGSAFVMTTSNTGHVAFVGLWQVPHHRFAWEPLDKSYDAWVSANGYKYDDPATAGFAMPEVMRFWATYPGYVVSMVWHKFVSSFEGPLWRGAMGGCMFHPFDSGPNRLLWILATAILLSILTGHEARRSILLGWPLFLNLPLYFLLQASGGRFLFFPAISIVVAGIPLMLEKEFWQRLWEKRMIALPVAVIACLVWLGRHELDQLMLNWDSFRYGTPFLDPAKSMLNVMK